MGGAAVPVMRMVAVVGRPPVVQDASLVGFPRVGSPLPPYALQPGALHEHPLALPEQLQPRLAHHERIVHHNQEAREDKDVYGGEGGQEEDDRLRRLP